MSWRVLCRVLVAAALVAAAAAAYCARADPAWRALAAPLAFEGRLMSLEAAGRAGSLRVRRVLRRPLGTASARWPRRGRVLRLALAAAPAPLECSARFEAPLKVGENYIVFAERRGRGALALGPPLRRSKKLLLRIRDVYAKDYIRPARVKPMRSANAVAGGRVRFECRASGRPPPRISWYLDGRPVEQIAFRRHTVHTYRRRSVLVIRHLKRTDSGRLECRALGAANTSDRTVANLTVVAAHTPSTQPPDTEILGSPCPMPDPSSFCMNGGTCVYFKQVGESACKCPDGFIGQRCENKDVSNHSSMYRSYSCKLGLSTLYYC